MGALLLAATSPSYSGMSDSDAIVVRRVLAGDGEAFAILVDRHYDRCLRLAVHLLSDRSDAEDAVQETLLRAYRALGQYREQDRFAAWLTRILANQCRTTRARRPRPVPEDLEWGTADRTTDHPADAAAARGELAYALDRLPSDQREAVVLRYADDLSYDEMATATGATVGALKMRVQRACRRLRGLLTDSAAATPARTEVPYD